MKKNHVVYQTHKPEEAKLLRSLGFIYKKENKIYEFEYNVELGLALTDLRRERNFKL